MISHALTSDLQGTVVVAAPHIDDEVLACGGTIASLPNREEVHILYATDGARSPSPVSPSPAPPDPALADLRAEEARCAARVLGVPNSNLRFLNLPDGELGEHTNRLKELLRRALRELRPDVVLFPFRYDYHPDHLALNRALCSELASLDECPAALEYFVYYRWRFVPGGDIRQYIRPDLLVSASIERVRETKRSALMCFKTQTTAYFEWQDRPVLTQVLLDEACEGPEMFVKWRPDMDGRPVLLFRESLVAPLQRIERSLKRWKDLARSTLVRPS